jgi:hypothetical protein
MIALAVNQLLLSRFGHCEEILGRDEFQISTPHLE